MNKKTIPPNKLTAQMMYLFDVNMHYTSFMQYCTSHLREPMKCGYYEECILRQQLVMGHAIQKSQVIENCTLVGVTQAQHCMQIEM